MSQCLSVRVDLAERSYDVYIGNGLLPHIGEYSTEVIGRKKCAVVTDSNVAPHYAQTVLDSLAGAGIEAILVTVPAGESSKSLTIVEDVCSQMLRAGLDRKSFLVALGGGVIGDLAGFAASIFMRGIPFIQVPTTILSQVDSSVGGKTGVNTAEGKNLIGTFYQPRLVLADVDTLQTLPSREYCEGFAEIIKHAAIRDALMFEAITDVADEKGDLAELIKKEPCVVIDTRNPDAYAAGHLPGAVNVHEIFTYLATSTPEGIQELKTKFADAFGAAGLSGKETAVIYEQSMNSGFGQSCRGYYLLTMLGYPKVKVLHGGYDAWTMAGLPTTKEVPSPV